jgi:hypothetical protein
MPDQLGALMNPMLPQARTPQVPPTSMVSPQAQQQATAPQPQQPGMPQMPQPPMPPPMMPQQMPDIVQMMIQRAMQQKGPLGDVQGTQSTPLTGAPPTVGGM